VTELDSTVWAVQIFTCVYMAGVISVIQLIHYPSFVQIDSDRFAEFHRNHSNALGVIAAPAMCAELGSAIWIAKDGGLWPLVNLGAVITLWGITFLVSVPLHNRLAKGFDMATWTRLLRTNWLRTTIWLVRAIAMFVFLNQRLGAVR